MFIFLFFRITYQYLNLTTPTNQPTQSIILQSYQTLDITINIDQVNLTISNSSLLKLIVASSTYDINQTVQYKIFNNQLTSIIIQLNLSSAFNISDDKVYQEIQQLQITTYIKTPSRAQYGQPFLFPLVLSQNLLSSYSLPFNMPEVSKFIIEQAQLENAQSSQPYSQSSYWQTYESSNSVTTIAIPYLPFFNCQGYGKYVYLYNLLEDSDQCKLITPQDTTIVKAIPTDGLNSQSDSCDYSLQCSYMENLTQTSQFSGNFWWQSKGSILFYIAELPISYDTIINNQDDTQNAANPYFANLISSQSEEMVGVYFYTDGIQTSVPNQFTLTILYNQVDQQNKKIIQAYVKATNYTTDLSGSYTLRIQYRAMNYLEMLNSFQFGFPIYFLIYIVLGLVTILIVASFWMINKFFTQQKQPPKLRIYQTFLVVVVPALSGSIRGTIPIIIFVEIMDYLLSQGLFDPIYFYYDPGSLSQTETASKNIGRTGMFLMMAGICFLKIAKKLFIPRPDEEEERLIKQNHEKEMEEKTYEVDSNHHEFRRDSVIKDEIKENRLAHSDQSYPISRQGTIQSKHIPASAQIAPTNTLGVKQSIFKRATLVQARSSSFRENSIPPLDSVSPQHNQIQLPQEPSDQQEVNHQNQSEFKPNNQKKEEEEDILELIDDLMNSKGYHYEFVCLISACFLLLELGFSYMDIFSANIYYFIIILLIVEYIYQAVMSNLLLKEFMLIQPLMTCIEVIMFIMFLSAYSLSEFVFAYLLRLLIRVLFRTYFMFFWRKLAAHIDKLLEQWQINYQISKSHIEDQNISFYLGGQTQNKFNDEQSIEYVIHMSVYFSSKLQGIILKPMALVLIKIFQVESQILSLYNIQFWQFDYYIAFAFLFIIPQIIIEIYLLNCFEIIHGYRLFDYFDYCKYRNDYRNQKLFEHSLNLDKSINNQYRSVDNMKFTDQFYYNGTILIYSILMIILGVTIVIMNNTTFYQDSVFFPMLFFTFIIIPLVHFVVLYIWNKFDVWKLPDNKQKLSLDSLDEYLNPIKENLEQIIEVETIKKHFIQINKEWLIQNLNLFITADLFNGQDDFLMQTYQMLQNEERKVVKEAIRNEQIIKKQKELELKQRKKPKKTIDSQSEKSPMTRERLQSQYTDEVVTQQTIRIKKSKAEVLKKMISTWYYLARQNLFLKFLVQEVLQENQAEQCKRCGLDIELRVVELIPFEKMANKFKFRTIGTPFNKMEWKKFYETHQKFITLCIDCEIGYKSKLLQRQHQSANDVMRQTQQNSLAKALIYKWLYISRSNLLHRGM